MSLDVEGQAQTTPEDRYIAPSRAFDRHVEVRSQAIPGALTERRPLIPAGLVERRVALLALEGDQRSA